uniref:Uncharacterized protein n=1 Tax=Aureoumbra lagunensis TaxID=44058 RepID=A0A7S3NHP1_9STRA
MTRPMYTIRKRTVMANDEEVRIIAETKRRDVSDELLRRVREYLAVRESTASKRDEIALQREAVMDNPLWQMGNYLFSLESLLPKEAEMNQDVDPLDYAELARFGYSSLVEEIMDAGGRVEVSRALGMELKAVTKAEPPPPKIWRASDQPDTTGKIALGAARSERIEQLVNDPAAFKPKATTSSIQKSSVTTNRPSRKRSIQLKKAADQVIPPSPYWPLPLAALGLKPMARVYAALFLFSLAAQPDAKATQQAISAFADSQSVFEAVHDVSFAFLAANIAAVVITVLRSPPTLDDSSIVDSQAARIIRALLAGPLTLE